MISVKVNSRFTLTIPTGDLFIESRSHPRHPMKISRVYIAMIAAAAAAAALPTAASAGCYSCYAPPPPPCGTCYQAQVAPPQHRTAQETVMRIARRGRLASYTGSIPHRNGATDRDGCAGRRPVRTHSRCNMVPASTLRWSHPRALITCRLRRAAIPAATDIANAEFGDGRACPGHSHFRAGLQPTTHGTLKNPRKRTRPPRTGAPFSA